MSRSSKGSVAGAESAAEPTFEEAIQRLEAIVSGMESEDLPLETLLSRYEEGMKLAQWCEARLNAAEVRIQQLTPAPAPGADSPPPAPRAAE